MQRGVLGVIVLLASLLPFRPAPAPAQTADERLQELTVTSSVLGREARVRVLLPAGYDDPANADRTWPILWLLHGVGDDETSWTANSAVEELTADLPLVVAMPEAGRNSSAGWYSDWVDGPAWETFHLTELLPLVEARFHAGGSRERRAVAGLSMGGFGAMLYAARHPDLFAAAASFSGAVHPTLLGAAGAIAFELLGPATGTPGDPIWGPFERSQTNWHGHDPFDLAPNLRALDGALWLRTGNGIPCPGDALTSAPLEVGVYPMNLALHGRLAALGIEHSWFDRGCGTHEWRHWEDDLAAVLPGLMAVLEAPAGSSASAGSSFAFDHRFTDDVVDVWGWRFAVDGRRKPAWTTITDASAAGLTVAGSGRLTVTTPSGFTFATGLTEVPLRVTLPAPAEPTAPPPSTTTTTTVPRLLPPASPSGALPTTGGEPAPLLVAAAVGVIGALLGRRLSLSGAGAGGRRPTRSG